MTEIKSELLDKRFTPEVLTARELIITGVTPEEAIKRHPGKGGKVFEYIKHTYGSETMRNAFGPTWGFKTGRWEYFDDRSAAIECTLWVDYSLKDDGGEPTGEYYRQEVTEVGMFEGGTSMPKAFIIGSAASRGLMRCMMRMFGVGQEFYDKEDDVTPAGPWTALKRFGVSRGIDEETIIQAFKDAEITGDTLVEPQVFERAYKIVSELAGTSAPLDKVPDELKKKKEA